jgi:hypothetical protein
MSVRRSTRLRQGQSSPTNDSQGQSKALAAIGNSDDESFTSDQQFRKPKIKTKRKRSRDHDEDENSKYVSPSRQRVRLMTQTMPTMGVATRGGDKITD